MLNSWLKLMYLIRQQSDLPNKSMFLALLVRLHVTGPRSVFLIL